MSTWTLFWDMHSGGDCKVSSYKLIFIEAPYREACEYFEDTFGRDPFYETCGCCGPDYAVESGTLQQIEGFHRKRTSHDKFAQLPHVLHVTATMMKSGWKI